MGWITDFFRIVSIVGTLVSLAHLGFMPANSAQGAIVLLVILLGIWRGLAPASGSGDCGGCLISSALPLLGMMGLVFSVSIGNPGLLRLLIAEFTRLALLLFFVIYLPLRMFCSVFRSKK